MQPNQSFVDNAYGKVVEFKVAKLYPRVIQDTSYLTVVDARGNSLIVENDPNVKVGASLTLEIRGRFATILETNTK